MINIKSCQLNKLKDNGIQEKEAKETARNLEKTFATYLLKEMFSGLSTSSLGGKGQSNEIMKSFLIDALAEKMPMGLCEIFYKAFTKNTNQLNEKKGEHCDTIA